MFVVVSLVVLMLLIGLFRFLGLRWHAVTAGLVLYLVFGGFVAGTQLAGGGECPTWRNDGYWKAIVGWPGDFYDNVVAGPISARRYLIPRTCELASNPTG